MYAERKVLTKERRLHGRNGVNAVRWFRVMDKYKQLKESLSGSNPSFAPYGIMILGICPLYAASSTNTIFLMG
jgi:hypothetical protein